MWPYLPDLLATPVPRYTSFPTAAEFGGDVGPADLEAAIAGTTGDVSIYVHIPFCETICWYCGCNTGRANRRERLASYLESQSREIGLVGQLLPPSARVRRIAFGGGSPNAIAATDFVRLFLSLTHSLPLDNPIISVELDPRALNDAWMKALAGIGVRQASLGVQTFEPRLQKAIGRIQSAELIERATAQLRGAGISSLNFDLMYGLPGQTETDLAATLERSITLGADRIALFGYAHVPHLIPRQRKIDSAALPDQAARFAMAAMGHDRLLEAGYSPIGFDHFALPDDPLARAASAGRLHRNFQGFTDDEATVLIGLGASAISSFPALLIQNEKNAGRYGMMLSQDRLPAVRGIRRSPEDQAIGRAIEHLLCDGRAAIPSSLLHDMKAKLRAFTQASLAHFEGENLVITKAGLPYARTIAAALDPYRDALRGQFSSAV